MNYKKTIKKKNYSQFLILLIFVMGENPLRCTTQDEKGLVFTTILFYSIFWSP